MEITGKIVQVLPMEQGTSAKGPWQKANIIVEYGENPQYMKKVCLSNMKKASEFASLQPGTYGKFFIEVESREHQGRWYHNVNCWKWELGGAAQTAPQGAPQGYAPQTGGNIPVAQPYAPTPGQQMPPQGYPQAPVPPQGYPQQPYGQQYPPAPTPTQGAPIPNDDVPF